MADVDADVKQSADDLLDRALLGLSPHDATLLLAALANRIAARLNGVARGQSQATRGEPEWAAWAALQNASRNLILQSSTCRDLASRLSRPDR